MSRVLTSPKLKRSELSILFVGSRAMHALNKTYRGMDKTTDVLSFPLYESPRGFPADQDFLIGDIVVNLDIALERACTQETDIQWEAMILLVHGCLHLIGYDHEKGPSQAKRMKRKENEILSALKEMDQ